LECELEERRCASVPGNPDIHATTTADRVLVEYCSRPDSNVASEINTGGDTAGNTTPESVGWCFRVLHSISKSAPRGRHSIASRIESTARISPPWPFTHHSLTTPVHPS